MSLHFQMISKLLMLKDSFLQIICFNSLYFPCPRSATKINRTPREMLHVVVDIKETDFNPELPSLG
jgi:hypothetical protein